MELRHLRYFVAVAEELHFGHAANRLNTSQPSLSQQIRDLERELKVDLFLRTKRRVALTPAGQRFLQEARGILASAERAAGLAREAERGESRKLVVGISPETDWPFLGKTLRLFADHALSVEVVFQNLTPEAQVDALRGGHIDVGFVGLPLEAEGMVTETTGRARLVGRASRKAPHGSQEGPSARGALERGVRALAEASVARLATTSCSPCFAGPVLLRRSPWKEDFPRPERFWAWSRPVSRSPWSSPALEQMPAAGVVFRPLSGNGVFTEKGVIYRRDDSSPILASFLHEVRATPRERPGSEAVESVPRRKASGHRPAALGRKGAVKVLTRRRAPRR